MRTGKHVSRRDFLRLSALGSASAVVLAACGQAAPASPTAAPQPTEAPKPTEAAKPAATTAPAAAPTATTAPAAKPTEAPKPTAAPTVASAAKPAGQAVELRIHLNQDDQYYGVQKDSFEADVDGFRTKHPGLTVKWEPVPGWTAEYFPKIFAFVSANQLGDVVWYPPRHRSQLSWGAKYKIVRPLDDIMKSKNYDPKKEFLPAALESSTWDGKLYFLNFNGEPSVPVVAYNKTAIEKAGAKIPEGVPTFDEITAWAQKITTKDVYGFSRGMHGGEPIGEVPTMRQWGIEFVDSTGKKSLFQEHKDNLVKFLKWRYDLIYTYKVSPAPDATTDMEKLFVGEKVLAMPVWPVYINYFPKVLVKDKFEVAFGLDPVAKKGDKIRSMLNEHVFGVTVASKNPEVAFDYVAWICGKEVAVQGILSGKGAPIARPDFWEDSRLYEKYPAQKLLKDIMMNIEPDFFVGNFRGEQYDDAFVNVYQQVEMKKLTPEQAADQLHKDCQAILDKEPA